MVEVLYYAIPFFVLLLVVEALSFRHYHEDDLVGYELARHAHEHHDGPRQRDDQRRLEARRGRHLRRALRADAAPRIPHDWWAWIRSSSLDDLAYYWFHRVTHVSRFFWASHVVHHSSTHFNLSTALRQTWVPMTYLPFWLPLLLLGFPPWMVLLAQSWSLIYQFGLHTERIGRLPRPIEAVLQHAARTTASTTAPTSSTWTATTPAS